MATSRYINVPTIQYNDIRSKEIGTKTKIEPRDDDILLRWTDSVSARGLASQYLGSPEYYWVILSLNNVFLESEFILGQQIRIPKYVGTFSSGL